RGVAQPTTRIRALVAVSETEVTSELLCPQYRTEWRGAADGASLMLQWSTLERRMVGRSRWRPHRRYVECGGLCAACDGYTASKARGSAAPGVGDVADSDVRYAAPQITEHGRTPPAQPRRAQRARL